MRNLTFLVVLSTALSSWALAPHSYYGDLIDPAAKATNLKSTLNRIMNSDHIVRNGQPDQIVNQCANSANCRVPHSLGYGEARENLFGSIHLQNDRGEYFVRDYYCLHDYTEDDFGSGRNIGPGIIPYHEVLNTEHVWPQSKFERARQHSSETKKGDMHHLLPSNTQLNSLRGSFDFGEVEVLSDGYEKYRKSLERKLQAAGLSHEQRESVQHDKECLDQVKLGYSNDHSSTIRFEPPDASKGDIARALFYFSTRYDGDISSEQEKTLRKWHKQDPVDQMERHRNEEISKIENVRNPFIDMPELVEQIDNF